jgi:hypothetical protein
MLLSSLGGAREACSYFLAQIVYLFRGPQQANVAALMQGGYFAVEIASIDGELGSDINQLAGHPYRYEDRSSHGEKDCQKHSGNPGHSKLFQPSD